jgi:hypothetical protein
MKKIYTSLILMTIGLKIIANPIALPTIEISELLFDISNNWKLELGYYEVNQNGLTIDSIFIYSTTDTIKLPTYPFIGSIGVFVITNDSLDTDFQIKRQGDTIKVVSYCMVYPFEDVLIFGNCQGASINYPREGQSISKYWMYYVKDNSPSIGASNDTTGMCGTIKGIIYDKYSAPVSQIKFCIDYQFETSENGEYSTRVYSKPTTFNQLSHIVGQYTTQSVSITEISYIMEPDSVIERDIYLLDTLTTGLNDLTINNTPVKIYPNPISATDKLMVEIDLPVITSNIWIEITSLDGKLINKEKITNTKSLIDTPNTNGIYILRVLFDKQIISSNRILVTNE